MEIMNLRGNPQYKESAIDYFQKIWATDESKPVYEDCISRSLVTESPLYLSTGHVGYYEKYGFKYVCTGYHPWGESSRVYECQLNLRLIG